MPLLRLAFATGLLIALSGAASARDVTVRSETSLRRSPVITSEVLTVIPKGERIEVGACDVGWCSVTYNLQDGYALARNLGIASGGRTTRRGKVRTEYGPEYADAIVYGPPYPTAVGLVDTPTYYDVVGYGPFFGWRGGYWPGWGYWPYRGWGPRGGWHRW